MHILNRVVLILISVAPTFAGAVSLPSDVLPVVQKRIMFKAAEKTACVTLFPELTGVIDDAWKNWPASRIKIQLLINGKEWIDPPLRYFYEDELVNMKKMSKEKEPKKTVYRDSEVGQFVTKKYAEDHPKTTEKERVRVGSEK